VSNIDVIRVVVDMLGVEQEAVVKWTSENWSHWTTATDLLISWYYNQSFISSNYCCLYSSWYAGQLQWSV